MSSGSPRLNLKSIGLRLGLLYTLVFIVSSLGLMIELGDHLLDMAKNKDKELCSERLHYYQQLDLNQGRAALLATLKQDRATNAATGFAILLRDKTGRVLDLTVPNGWQARELLDFEPVNSAGDWHKLWKLNFRRHRSDFPNPDKVYYTSLPLDDETLIFFGFSQGRRDDYLEDLGEIFARYLIWAALLALVGGFFFSRRALAPIHDLTHTVKRVASGAVGARVELRSGNTELTELAMQFNTMLARIETLVTAMREALDNVAHELRTPLSRLRIGLERAATSDDIAVLQATLGDCAEETERMSSLITAIMDISAAEAGLLRLNYTEINLGRLLREIFDLFEYTAEDRQISLTADVAAGLTAWADPVRLRQMLVNLVDNALKYGRAGGQVGVTARETALGLSIAVADDGPGIEASEINRIFERLYRNDRSRSSKGLGLGLALVQAYAQAHGGSIGVNSPPGGGATFTLRLPSSRSASAPARKTT